MPNELDICPVTEQVEASSVDEVDDHGRKPSKVEALGLEDVDERDCPDGGYGWVVVICLILMYAVSWGKSRLFPPPRHPGLCSALSWTTLEVH